MVGVCRAGGCSSGDKDQSRQGQATDIEIHAREILSLRERLVNLYAHHTGREASDIADAKERDNFMSPEQARDFGLIDAVVTKRDA